MNTSLTVAKTEEKPKGDIYFKKRKKKKKQTQAQNTQKAETLPNHLTRNTKNETCLIWMNWKHGPRGQMILQLPKMNA